MKKITTETFRHKEGPGERGIQAGKSSFTPRRKDAKEGSRAPRAAHLAGVFLIGVLAFGIRSWMLRYGVFPAGQGHAVAAQILGLIEGVIGGAQQQLGLCAVGLWEPVSAMLE